jgi:hypothetical protein
MQFFVLLCDLEASWFKADEEMQLPLKLFVNGYFV